MPSGSASKKTAFATEQERPDVARRRRQWQARQASIDPKRLVFIDETWTKTNMAPLRGWGPRGQRLIGRAPHGRWRTLTFLAALRCAKSTAMAAFRGISGGGGAGDDSRAVASSAGSRPDACGGGHFEGAPELARGA